MKQHLAWLFLLILLPCSSTEEVCACSPACTCEPTSMTCEGLESEPCILSSTQQLVIRNSPNLKTLELQSSTLTDLTVINTGIVTIEKGFLRDLPKLQKLELVGNGKLKSVDLTNNQKPYHPLSDLKINNSTEMTRVPLLEDCEQLTSLDLSSCGLTRVFESDLQDLDRLRFLSLSHNHDLAFIDREAFDDLSSLEEIHFDHCDLKTLYSDYFDEAYDSESLRSVTGLLNPYECLSLCDFIRWSDNHRHFWEYSVFGTCRIDFTNGAQFYTIWGLSNYNAGCSTALGIILGVTFGCIFFLCILGCLIVVFCGIDWRKYCCFCCESQRNRNNVETGTRAADTTRTENQYETIHYDPRIEKTGLNTIEPGMYAAAPPSYEDITKVDDQTGLANQANDPSSSTI